MDKDDYIHTFFKFRCGNSWEARRAWEYVKLHGDRFNYFNLPSLKMPTCSLRCRRCKTALDIDFAVIRQAEVYDYDCEHCYACNCFSSIAAINKLDRFRDRCEKYEVAWERRVYGHPLTDGDDDSAPRRSGRSGVPAKLRWQVLRRDEFRCRYCGASSGSSELHVDHVLSRADGGRDTIDNLVTACIECNLGKGSDSLFREPELRYLPSLKD